MANLLELYAHDFSELRRLKLREDGRFGYEALPLYWTEPGRYPFLIRVDGSVKRVALLLSNMKGMRGFCFPLSREVAEVLSPILGENGVREL